MKNILLKIVVVTVTVIFSIALIGGIVFWFMSRPVPQKPWDEKVIVAEFVRLASNDFNDTYPMFYYVLQNNSDKDYEITENEIIMNAKLLKEKSITSTSSEELVIEYPIFIPAHQRTRIRFHLKYELPESVKHKLKSAKKGKGEGHKIIANYLNTELDNLNGFVLFDKINRYQIDFNKGW